MQHLVTITVRIVGNASWAITELPVAASMLHFLPTPRLAFEQVVSTLVTETMREPLNDHRSTALMAVLGTMTELYVVEKQEFSKTLSLDAGGDDAGDAGGSHTEGGGAYLKGEEQAQRVEVASQSYLDRVIQSQRSSPACFIPWLLSAASCQNAAAFRALQPMAVLCNSLCAACIGPVAFGTMNRSADPEVRIATIDFLAAAIGAFPTAFCSHLLTLTAALPKRNATSNSDDTRVTATAVSAFANLTLSNKLKVSDVLAGLGVVLSSSDPEAAAVGVHVLRHLMEGASPADRAMMFMGVVHQIPQESFSRQYAIEAAVGLLSDTDKKSSALVGPALALAMEASSDEAAGAATALLAHLQPSASTLRSLQASLQGAAPLAGVHERVRTELFKFAQRGFTGGDDKENEAPVGGEEGDDGGRKRPRQSVSDKNTTSALQQDVLRTLQENEAVQRRRRTAVALGDSALCPPSIYII